MSIASLFSSSLLLTNQKSDLVWFNCNLLLEFLSFQIQYLCYVRHGLHWAHAPQNNPILLMLQPSPNRAGLSKDEELQLSWQVLFTVTKNPGTTNIIPYKIQVYQWQYMYNNTFHNKNHLTSSSYCVQMPWHQLSQQLGRRHLLTNHHISFKFLYMTKHQGTGRLAWNRHFKANLPWEKLERNHKSITHNLSVKSLHCPKHWLVAGLATSHCLTQWMDTELTTLRIPNLPMQA